MSALSTAGAGFGTGFRLWAPSVVVIVKLSPACHHQLGGATLPGTRKGRMGVLACWGTGTLRSAAADLLRSGCDLSRSRPWVVHFEIGLAPMEVHQPIVMG